MAEHTHIILLPSVVARFLSKVDKLGEDECWPWTGQLCRQGYGKISYRNFPERRRFVKSHQYALTVAGKPKPFAGAMVLHSCDNPPCCNPKHLRWGTCGENVEEAFNRDLLACGERHARSKLTTPQVMAILDDPRTGPRIAADYGVSRSLITKIKRGKNWRHLTKK